MQHLTPKLGESPILKMDRVENAKQAEGRPWRDTLGTLLEATDRR